MTIGAQVFAGLTLTVVCHGLASVAAGSTDEPAVFETASVRLEQNVTDEDVEVVFEVTGGDEGLAKLTVVSPDGRTVVDFRAPDGSTMGVRSFKFESPEPQDVEGLKQAYPKGTYVFTGKNVLGNELRAQADLHHALPAPVSFRQPRPGATGISIEDLEIAWAPVAEAVAYIVELEQEELNLKLNAQLPSPAVALTVPRNLLAPGVEYKLSIGTVSSAGNISVVETTFTTSE